MQSKHNKCLKPAAKELRKNMTPQEKKLWYGFLREYPTRILRQKVMGRFILDFYCAKAKIAIELDGGQHYSEEGLTYDVERTKVLNTYRVEVIRFSNKDINENFYEVCQKIDYEIQNRTAGGDLKA